MISESDISQSDLQKILEATYAFKVNQLTFLPKGEASWGYVVDSDKGRYFFKIFKDAVSNESFEFTRQLHDKCGIDNLSFPQLTQVGEIRVVIGGHQAVLFNFIDGKTEKEIGLTQPRLAKLGEILAKVHLSVQKIGELKTKENFEIVDRNGFEKVVAFVDKPQQLKSEPEQKAFELIRKQKNILQGLFSELDVVSTKLKQRDVSFVNCHRDPTPQNILITPDEEIYLIDWDEPIFAPKERDLVFFSQKDRFPGIAEGYAKIADQCVLDEQIVRFYDLSWKIQEVADLGGRLFFEKNELKQSEHNYEELEGDIKDLQEI